MILLTEYHLSDFDYFLMPTSIIARNEKISHAILQGLHLLNLEAQINLCVPFGLTPRLSK